MVKMPAAKQGRVRVITTDVLVLEALSQILADSFKLEWVQGDAWPDQALLADGELLVWVDQAEDKLLLSASASQTAPIIFPWPLSIPETLVSTCQQLVVVHGRAEWQPDVEVLRVLHADQRAGRAIQKRLLPNQSLSNANLSCELGFFPSLLLSGDFVDFFEADRPSRVVCILADVAGHGVSSAMVTVIIKSLINRLRRNLARSSSFDLLSPARVLERINAELISTGLGKHATVFVGLFDSEQGRVNYAVAGHTPLPMLVDGNGARKLEGTGRPVGLFDQVEYHEHSEDFDANGFHCVIASDGVMDLLAGENIQSREANLASLVQQCGGNLDQLIASLDMSEDVDLPDDVTLLLINAH